MKALATNQKIFWFHQRAKDSSLELSPDFQRNAVWLQPQKDYLIETILLGLPVPEIYLVERINDSGEAKYIVVDGQQRLRTVIQFINEEFQIKGTLGRFPHVKVFSDLTSDEKQRFWGFPMVVRDLEDSSDDDIRDLFQRLNKYSVKLNDQELRNARFKGCFLETVQKISEQMFWVDSGIFSANDFRRMLDLEFISILLSTLIMGVFNRKERVDECYVNYEEEFENSNFYINKFSDILKVIDYMLPDIKKRRWRNKGDFFTLFLSIDECQLSLDAIEKLTKLKNKLQDFEEKTEAANRENSPVEQKFKDYYQASVTATNDKESRVKRTNILTHFIKETLCQS